MTNPVRTLQSEVSQTIRLLDQSPLFSFTKEERESLKNDATVLNGKLDSIEGGFLTIGILGGTGVGKSTLMNALAGAEIASTSHRRPHTEGILIYRYVEANPLPELPLSSIPWREITHQEQAMGQILLCDLPDFDSLVGEHREHVVGFMEHLDMLIWVSSPEKYADRRFYELLLQVPKAKQNFYFVLNKVDLLFTDNALETGYEQMTRMAGRFQEHIKKSGIDLPLVYTVSSQDALHAAELAPWNHFPAFKQQVFQQRDIKQIKAVKAANLDVEVRMLLSRFDQEVLNLQAFERIVLDAIKALKRERPQWVHAGHELIRLWLKGRVRQQLLFRHGNPSNLIGPGRNLAHFLEGWRRKFSDQEDLLSDPASFISSNEIAETFTKRVGWIRDRLHRGRLRENLPPAFQTWIDEELDPEKAVDDLHERFSGVVASGLTTGGTSSLWRFQIAQFLMYALLLIFFLFAVGGETAWQQLFENPGGRSLVRLLLSGIHTLFSAKGLAALASYVILNFLFALRFYNKYKRLREQTADRLINTMEVTLGQVWESLLEALSERLNRMKADITHRISIISNLR